MGRPTKFNRPDAIAVAMDTFWEKGYNPTSVSDLASAMSITRSSFYNSFNSRKAIFDEALALYQKGDAIFDTDAEQDGYCPAKAIRHFFRQVCDRLASAPDSRGCLTINCYVQASDDCPPPEGVKAFVEAKWQQFHVTVKNAVKLGIMPADTDSKATADSLLSFLIGINIMGKKVPDAKRLWTAADVMLTSMGFVERSTH